MKRRGFAAALLLWTGGCAAQCADLPDPEQVVAADARERGAVRYEDDALREFVLYSYRGIAEDIVAGDGPYLVSLETLFGAHCGDGDALTWLRAILRGAGTAPDFARRLALAHRLALSAAGCVRGRCP